MAAITTKTPEQKTEVEKAQQTTVSNINIRQNKAKFEDEAVAMAKLVYEKKMSMTLQQRYTNSYEKLKLWAKEENYTISEEDCHDKIKGLINHPELGKNNEISLEWSKTVNMECLKMDKDTYTSAEYKHFTEALMAATNLDEMRKLDTEWLLHVLDKKSKSNYSMIKLSTKDTSSSLRTNYSRGIKSTQISSGFGHTCLRW